ncbi:MAG: energy transducer TonB [Acidobacteria bacterium]|nr:energy transducer TonB [Acidobacteriota bacterium]
MFSNLIESGSHAADLKRRGRFLLGTTLFYGLLVAATGVGSIYAYNVRLDYDPDYELVALMRFPPAVARSEEPRREQPRAAAGPSRANQIATRTEISVQTPYHGEHIASANTPEINPRQAVIISNFNSSPPEASGGPVGPHTDGPPYGTGTDVGPRVTETGVVEGPPPMPTPTPRPSPAPRQNSGPLNLSTIISSKVIDKPAPPYPPVARAAGIFGPVAVQILVDEQGRVISARATSGNPLLQAAAVQAAHKARFTPTLLGGQPVKVTGSITYNFVLR